MKVKPIYSANSTEVDMASDHQNDFQENWLLILDSLDLLINNN